MEKRIKSFFISLGSFAIVSASTLVLTPEWVSFVNWIGATGHAKLLGWGVPAVIVIILGKFLDEIWRQVLNHYISKRGDYRTIAGAASAGPDLY